MVAFRAFSPWVRFVNLYIYIYWVGARKSHPSLARKQQSWKTQNHTNPSPNWNLNRNTNGSRTKTHLGCHPNQRLSDKKSLFIDFYKAKKQWTARNNNTSRRSRSKIKIKRIKTKSERNVNNSPVEHRGEHETEKLNCCYIPTHPITPSAPRLSRYPTI